MTTSELTRLLHQTGEGREEAFDELFPLIYTELYERALRLDPFNTLFQAFYGVNLLYVHQYDQAVATLRDALGRSPDHPVAWAMLRAALHVQGSYEEAMEEWRMLYAARGDREAEYPPVSRVRTTGPPLPPHG